MKLLRRFIEVNTLILATVGLRIVVRSPMSLPVKYEAGEPYQSLALVNLLAMALAGTAIALLMQSRHALTGELRKLAFGLSLANGLISLMALLEQLAFGGSPAGWLLILIPLAVASVLVWLARRPLRPEEVAAEIDTLKIPDEIRQGLLRQIGEAAAQEERNRLARDLHDSIKQQLFSINVGAATAQERWERDPEGARTALADVRRAAREAMVEMQAMLHQLRPEALSTAGLIEALREQCEALGYRTGAEVILELGEPVPDDRMPPSAPEALFRMGQEMLANVARHARARRVRLWLGRETEDVVLRIEDDGQGFDLAAETSGMGLRNLKERAEALRGRIETASSPAAGTRVAVRIPLIPSPVGVVPVDVARAGLRDCADHAVYFALLILIFKVPLLEKVFERIAGLNTAIWVLFFGVLIFLSWWFSRHRPPRDTSVYARRQRTTLSFLILGNLVGILWAGNEDLPIPSFMWISSIAMYCVAAIGLVEIHRTSTLRRFWRKEARGWLWLVLSVEAGLLLALGTAFFAPWLLALEPLAACCLLIMGVAYAYLASRQPAVGGISS